MKFNDRSVRITEKNFRQDFPKRFDNCIYSFNSNQVIGDSYKSSYSFKFVYKGWEQYLINGKLITLKPNEGLLVNQGSDIKVGSHGKSISIFFHSDLIDGLVKNLSRTERCIIIHSEPIRDFSSIIKSELIRLIEKPESRVNDLLYFDVARQLIIKQWHLLCATKIKLQERVKSKPDYIFSRLESARNLLVDTATHSSLDMVARESAISKWHLNRSFKEVYGISPMRLQVLSKICKSQEMLYDNITGSVSEISKVLGYPDVPSFSKQFKKIIGKSPTQYKAQLCRQ